MDAHEEANSNSQSPIGKLDMPTANALSHHRTDAVSSLDLSLVINDHNVLTYLAQFQDEDVRCEKALEALKVGVIAIQSASPTLDTQVVQVKFAEVEGRMREQLREFQGKVKDDLCRYFAEQDGVVPRSIDGTFGENGTMTRTFQSFFHPTEGKLCNLMQSHIGPHSKFGKALDPQNKEGIVALIEARVHELVEAKLDEVLKQFSLDQDDSAMSRLKEMLSEFFGRLNQSLGIKLATTAEAEKGHVKGFVFEEDLYQAFAEMGRQLGDETECVRGIVGAVSRCKKGDYLATLGETSGAPGKKVTVEVKDQALRLKDAIDELQDAKKNREAACGIFVFARGCEPPEIGDFRRIGEDFYVTVDRDDLAAGSSLPFLDAAYKIARGLTIAAAKKDQGGELDLQKIHDQVDALAQWSGRIADMAVKARTIQNNGKQIEQCANELKIDLDAKVAVILRALQQAESA
jgi:hypothetical protein